MQKGMPSRTALGAAGHRAAHQVLEGGKIFSDPLALPMLGAHLEDAVREGRDPARARMRLFVCARSRFAEDSLAAAMKRGVTQLIVMGAGLDTFAYRGPRPGLRIFEVDHPDTQAWKRGVLEEAKIAIPDNVTYAPVDFEHDSLAAGLEAAGFDRSQQTFVFWLGVTPYLTKEAIASMLAWIGMLPGGGHVVFDYAEPPEETSAEARAFLEQGAARVAAIGEPWISFFKPAELHDELRALGFRDIEDIASGQIGERFLGMPSSATAASGGGGHILRAATV